MVIMTKEADGYELVIGWTEEDLGASGYEGLSRMPHRHEGDAWSNARFPFLILRSASPEYSSWAEEDVSCFGFLPRESHRFWGV